MTEEERAVKWKDVKEKRPQEKNEKKRRSLIECAEMPIKSEKRGC